MAALRLYYINIIRDVCLTPYSYETMGQLYKCYTWIDAELKRECCFLFLKSKFSLAHAQ